MRYINILDYAEAFCWGLSLFFIACTCTDSDTVFGMYVALLCTYCMHVWCVVWPYFLHCSLSVPLLWSAAGLLESVPTLCVLVYSPQHLSFCLKGLVHSEINNLSTRAHLCCSKLMTFFLHRTWTFYFLFCCIFIFLFPLFYFWLSSVCFYFLVCLFR